MKFASTAIVLCDLYVLQEESLGSTSSSFVTGRAADVGKPKSDEDGKEHEIARRQARDLFGDSLVFVATATASRGTTAASQSGRLISRRTSGFPGGGGQARDQNGASAWTTKSMPAHRPDAPPRHPPSNPPPPAGPPPPPGVPPLKLERSEPHGSAWVTPRLLLSPKIGSSNKPRAKSTHTTAAPLDLGEGSVSRQDRYAMITTNASPRDHNTRTTICSPRGYNYFPPA